MISLPFRNREDAARQLAVALERYRNRRPVILAIPRGAVPIGRIVADALNGALDVVLVRKLGAPGNPELAIGAVDERGGVMLTDYAEWTGADAGYIEREAQRQLAVIRERRAHYHPGRAGPALAGRTVIVLDDGLATGSTMIAALGAVRAQAPTHLVCAVPVAARESLAKVVRLADDVVCLATPSPFDAVGLYYRDFATVTDEQVIDLLAATGPASPARATSSQSVRIPAKGALLDGELTLPTPSRGLVVFVHGSGSSRHSPRNRFVASALNRQGLGTLLFDLLSPEEDRDPAARFDIPLLASRLASALAWTRAESTCRHLPLGLFGASTGAAAALIVAAEHADDVVAVVSRGGRPDLAGRQALSQVHADTLLIVGGQDADVLELNRLARSILGSRAELVVISGATHLFEENGALGRVAQIAGDWLARKLAQGADHVVARVRSGSA